MEATRSDSDNKRQELAQANNRLQQCTQRRVAVREELAAHLRAQGEASEKAADASARLELLEQEHWVLADTVVVLRQVLSGGEEDVRATTMIAVRSGRTTANVMPVWSTCHIAGDV